MNIKNLKRAAEIERELPLLEKARELLSMQNSYTEVHDGDDVVICLPRSVNYNLLSAVNVEINKLKDEVIGL